MSIGSRRKAYQAGLKYGYRSGLEETVAEQIKIATGKVSYESLKITYQRPESTYTPDFILPNGVIVETKGRFVSADRTKHLLIKKQHGDKYDIRFVFQNPNAKLRKGAKTTYAQWCEKHNFEYATKSIPEEWFDD